MVYPWSNKAKEEDTVKEEVTEKEEVIIEEEPTIVNDEDIIKDTEKEEETIVWDNDDPRAILLNILKLEGYKMDSGELFNAYREASKESDNSIVMESFKKGLDQLSELGKIRSDSNGNIMTIQDFNREKSQQTDDEEDSEKETEVKEENEKDTDNNLEENNERSNDDLESIIQLKEETDSWLIEKLKNNKSNNNEADLREEVKELKDRIEKLESVIKNITKAFE
ncbi:MAG: hypothetical protein ACJZ33_02495 [Candidatus Poseidoniales archaeon]|jgi:hypothetical protein